ncbi:hypothetical protein VB796_03515, partial [Arcicella sp. LKC2W]|uniref:hypothetical protein n=1 Tax=Arcicella sp. LKC2W TaxID=2984198 RepID=UPI002B1F7156
PFEFFAEIANKFLPSVLGFVHLLIRFKFKIWSTYFRTGHGYQLISYWKLVCVFSPSPISSN